MKHSETFLFSVTSNSIINESRTLSLSEIRLLNGQFKVNKLPGSIPQSLDMIILKSAFKNVITKAV